MTFPDTTFTTGTTITSNWLNAVNDVCNNSQSAINVKAFGAVGNGITNDRAAIQSAIDYVNSIGGGVLVFPEGTYLLTNLDTSVTSNGVLHLIDYSNISFVGYGATLKSTVENNTKAIFGLDGVQNISFEGFNLEGTFVVDTSDVLVGPVITTAGNGAFDMVANNRQSFNISIKNITANNVYWGIRCYYITGSIAHRVYGVSVDTFKLKDVYYGINCQDNGDNFSVRSLTTINAIRSYFVYGCKQHVVQYESAGGKVFTDCVIAAFSQDTSDIHVTCNIVSNTSNKAHCSFESLNTTAQNSIKTITNCSVVYNDIGSPFVDSSVTPYTSQKSIRFVYWFDSVEQTTCPDAAFKDITLCGSALGYVEFKTAMPDNSCLLNIDNLEYCIDPNTASNPNITLFTNKGYYSKYGQNNSIKKNYAWLHDGTVSFNDPNGNQLGQAYAVVGSSSFTLTGSDVPVRLVKTGADVAGELSVYMNDSVGGYGLKQYASTITTAPNASNATVKIGNMDTTGRSVNATGTLNASGADYAEYENNGGLTIAKGSIVGFKTDGSLTLTFSEAIRFGVKSTNPSFVGGDDWTPDLPEVELPVKDETDTEESWQQKRDLYKQQLQQRQMQVEEYRRFVDRIAYSGKVPVNVIGATAGDYIIANEESDGSISGIAVTDPTFEQYKLSVGRVNRILEDGRAEVAVIVH